MARQMVDIDVGAVAALAVQRNAVHAIRAHVG
jgi:hypothetical protein